MTAIGSLEHAHLAFSIQHFGLKLDVITAKREMVSCRRWWIVF
jgi:hypothetical protein